MRHWSKQMWQCTAIRTILEDRCMFQVSVLRRTLKAWFCSIRSSVWLDRLTIFSDAHNNRIYATTLWRRESDSLLCVDASDSSLPHAVCALSFSFSRWCCCSDKRNDAVRRSNECRKSRYKDQPSRSAQSSRLTAEMRESFILWKVLLSL